MQTVNSQDTSSNKKSGFRRLLVETSPIMMGYLPLGIVFGFLFVQQGAEWWLAPLMSLLLFAGAIQFLSIGLLAGGVALPEVALACFVINLRHIFYGISVRSLLPKGKLKKLYCIYTLTDENFSLLTGLEERYVRENAGAICLINHFYWTFATLIGALIGESAEVNIPGIEFSLTALFTVLAIEQFKRNPRVVFLIICVVSYVLANFIAPDQVLFFAILIGVVSSLTVTSQTFARGKRT